jgi:CubicO group peptidase (beta-lactamase class C family)
MAELATIQGQLHRAIELYQRGLQVAEGWSQQKGPGRRSLPAASGLHLGLGNVFYQWNALAAAAPHLQRAVELGELERAWWRMSCYRMLAYLKLAQGDPEAAYDLLGQACAIRDGLTVRHLNVATEPSLEQLRILLSRTQPKMKTKIGLSRESWKILRKVALGILVTLVVLVGLGLGWLFLSYPPPAYVLRIARHREETVYDYKWLAARPMAASPSPFHFEEEPAEAMVQALFEQHPAIDDLDDYLEQTQTQAFIVIQNDAILYEKYFNGASRDSIVTSFSVAKSFASALIGAAIADGFIQSVDDPITDYLPELAERDPAFAGITIHNLLRMSSGIKYEESGWFDGDDTLTYWYPDLRKLALEETTISDPPGSYFLYNNYHPLLLGMILERATGMPVAAYLEAKIWQPVGMEFDGSWSLDSETTGFEKMESGINGRAIDFAKFGRLYLRSGDWDGEQVLPADWVAQSTRPDTSLDRGDYYPDPFLEHDGYYSYMWWGMRHDESDYDFMAHGNFGQLIYVSPNKNLIIVRNGESWGEFPVWYDMFCQFASDIELEADN